VSSLTVAPLWPPPFEAAYDSATGDDTDTVASTPDNDFITPSVEIHLTTSVLTAKGIDGVKEATVGELAERAGCSVATMYNRINKLLIELKFISKPRFAAAKRPAKPLVRRPGDGFADEYRKAA
jgi:hypothetical protein